jgi:hypothetical protein
VAFLGLYDVRGQVEHILRDLFLGDIVKVIRFLSNLVGIAQGDAEQALAARLQRDDVLARHEYDLTDSDHALFADGFPDHGERLLAKFPVRGGVIQAVQI